jgi:hypothetical protein
MGFLENLIAKVLSTRRGVEFTYFSCKSSSIFLSYTISFVSSIVFTYSTSIVESTGIDYLRDLQDTTTNQGLTREPQVDTPFYLSPSKSKL